MLGGRFLGPRSVLVALDAQRQGARRGIVKYKVLGHEHEEHIFLSAVLGGARVYRMTLTQRRASVPPAAIRQRTGVGPSQPPSGSGTTCLRVLRWRVQEQPGRVRIVSGAGLDFQWGVGSYLGVQWSGHVKRRLGGADDVAKRLSD
jgi:hypothetical protein